MTPEKFIQTYYPFAKRVQDETGIQAIALLAQSAKETGWGKAAPGNMMFGVKAGSSWKGDKQLITTTEIHSTANVKYPVIISVEKMSNGKFKYKVKDYFRKYPTPYESFRDHANLIATNARYKTAYNNRNDLSVYFSEMAKAGYATDPNYYNSMLDVVKSVTQRVETWVKNNPGTAAAAGAGGAIVSLILLFFLIRNT